ncbi:uncharacterized protein SPSK_06277 [Sporothrix schenckii 1099-18]|uniref:DUF7924 domain-containing protein n=1 Tax=Sporothrix schenckii 1099-18 TaxID=1397361 RepID=A0A0F2MLS3_SPOSC|nr:uncharacterized protein SPSK_06277 [Sporothrix schenckii 1099-18]KJR89984.1 hypothetical protein SPSK_06277 [Sporothrix schenckii 1099-18]
MDRKDADGYAIPRIPVSRARADGVGTGSPRKRKAVDDLGPETTAESSSPVSTLTEYTTDSLSSPVSTLTEFTFESVSAPSLSSPSESTLGSMSEASEYAPSLSSLSGLRTTVDDDSCRTLLARNNIHMRYSRLPKPAYVEDVVVRIRDMQRASPEPSDEALVKNKCLRELFEGSHESQVELHYMYNVFPMPSDADDDAIGVRARLPMCRRVVPFVGGDVPKFPVPTPDLLYGYNCEDAFPDTAHQRQLRTMYDEVIAYNDYSVSNPFVFPFFVIEFKGVAGNIRVASNQCLRGAATCVSIAETLNRRLLTHAQEHSVSTGGTDGTDGVTPAASIDSTAFSVAMDGQDARLYVSWKQDERNYYMTNVDCYALRRPDEYKRFRRMVRNIVDWGRSDRLKAIHRGLDQLLEEAQQRTPAPDTDAEAEAEAAAMDPMAMSMPEPMPEPTPGAGSSKASRHHSPPSGKGSSGGGGRSKKPRA